MLNDEIRARGQAALAALSLAALISCASTMASAALVISDKPTQNVTCAQGTCRATHAAAVLNATDLANLLLAGDIVVLADETPKDIEIATHFSWASAHTLTLDAFESVAVNKTVTVKEKSGLNLTFNDGSTEGALLFAANGRIEFEDTRSSLLVNSKSYKLLKNIHQLSKVIARNPSGNFAFVGNYDAAGDGTYAAAPIATTFSGNFEGLGNRISNLSIDAPADFANVGLFAHVATSGMVRDILLSGGSIRARGMQAAAGSLVGENDGTVYDVRSTANVSADQAWALGGLVGASVNGIIANSNSEGAITGNGSVKSGGLLGQSTGGRIMNSRATGSVNANGPWVGGLVGDGVMGIYSSYATGDVSGGDNAIVGGLVGGFEPSTATSFNTYATGAVSGGNNSTVGGLAGMSSAPISSAYSTGHVSGGSGSVVGGSIGKVFGSGFSHIYWDTQTSGTDQATGLGPCCTITGLTTAEFKAALPSGFDPNIWREHAPINGGYPYLIALPPPH